MNSETEKKILPPPAKSETLLSAFKHMLKSFRHNLAWKLLAFVLAIFMWAGLIAQDPTLVREKTFQDVAVSISGAETLKSNGLIVVTDLTSAPPTVRMKADVPQKEYANVTASTYNPRIDLSRIREKGTQQVRILTTTSNTYGSVVEISPDTIEVEVDEYKTSYRIPVAFSMEGEYSGDFYRDRASFSPDTVTVSGPKTLVDKVKRAVAVLDRSVITLNEDGYRNSVPITLVDENNEAIQSSLLSVTSESVRIDSVVVDIDLYPIKTVTLSGVGLVKGSPAEGYEVKRVTVSPNTIRAAGTQKNLEQFEIENLYLEQAVDLTDRMESFNEVIKVRRPTELINLSPDSVTVSVEIGYKQSEKTFTGVAIEAIDQKEGTSVSADIKKATVKLSGPQLMLDKLKAADIKLVYSLRGLDLGEHQVPLDIRVEALQGVNYTFTVEPLTVGVTIQEK